MTGAVSGIAGSGRLIPSPFNTILVLFVLLAFKTIFVMPLLEVDGSLYLKPLLDAVQNVGGMPR